MGVLYLFTVIGSLFGPSFNNKLGLIWTFTFGAICFSMCAFINILPAWRQNQLSKDDQNQSVFVNRNFVIAFLYIANMISGFGTAIMWVAQGEYISSCSTEDSKGLYFGVFWVIFMSS